MWGGSVHKLVQEAKKQGVEGSPLRKALAGNSAIFDYRAPEELGAGSITVDLHGDSPTWGRDSMTKMLNGGRNPVPDALIALNAGLGSYRSWHEVVHIAHGVGIPFAVTEYLQQSLEFTVKYIVRPHLASVYHPSVADWQLSLSSSLWSSIPLRSAITL